MQEQLPRSEAQTPRLCEERSDAAVQDRGFGLLRYARKDEGGTLAKTKRERSQRRRKKLAMTKTEDRIPPTLFRKQHETCKLR